ncbi:hypothetical protein MJT46_016909 [Ovis ammon polii x Ovis aries]|nr:hypothetical protein MJT46_016909 [Ovis ammon polii x Ovis aries]
MEPPRGPRKPLSWKRAKSLDRLQNAQKDSESWDCQGPSLPTGPFREGLCRTASDGTRCLKSLVQSVEAQDTTAAAPSPEETKDLLSEQRPQQDAKKDKAQWQAPQGWLRFVVNLFFRMSPEEPKEKTNKKAKGKEGPPEPAEPPESLGEPAPRKKAHSKKASRKKHSQRQHGVEEARGTRDQEAESQEAKAAEASCGEGANLGPAAREDIIIEKIVQLLQKVGDEWEEEQHQALQPVVTPRNPAPVVKKKSQEKMSSLKRAFSFKKYGSEEPKRAGATHVSSPGSRQPKRPNFLPLCVGGHRPSSSSLPGVEEPEVQEALPTDGGHPSLFELRTPAESGGRDEDLQDRAAEFKELIIQELVGLLQEVDGQLGKQIKRHPSFKKFFYEPSASSLRKLVATLRNQEAHTTEPKRTYPFVFGLGNQGPGNNYHTALSLTGLHYRSPSYSQFPYEEAQQSITGFQIQSPD